MADVMEFLNNLKKPVFETPSIEYGAPPPTIKVADPNNPLGKLSLPPPDQQEQSIPSDPRGTVPVAALNLGQPVSSSSSSSSTQTDDDLQILDRFKPEHRAQDAYYDMLNKIPQRDEHVPLGRRILAGLSTQGQGGLKRAEEINQAPYHRNLESFNQRAGILKDLSTSERGSNTNERQIMSQLLTERRYGRTQDERERHNLEAETNNRAKTELSQFLAMNPSYQLKTDENGNFVAWNPKDPSKPMLKTGVKSGEMSELARLMMVQGASNAHQMSQQEHDRLMEELRQQHRIELENVQAKLKVQTERDKPETPTETRIRRFNKAAELLNGDPENKRYVILGQPGTNDFELKLPPTAFWSSDADKKVKLDRFEELNRQIYGNDWKKQNPTEAANLAAARGQGTPAARATPTPNKSVTKPAGVPTNFIRARNKKTGQTGWIDPSKLGTEFEKVQ